MVLAPDDDGDQQEVDGRDQREDTYEKPDEEADAWLVRILIRTEAQEQDEELEDKCPAERMPIEGVVAKSATMKSTSSGRSTRSMSRKYSPI